MDYVKRLKLVRKISQLSDNLLKHGTQDVLVQNLTYTHPLSLYHWRYNPLLTPYPPDFDSGQLAHCYLAS